MLEMIIIKIVDRIINSIRKEFEVKEITESKKFLGIKVKNTEHGICLNQVEYIEKLFSKYGMSECKSIMTSIIAGEDRTSNEDNEKCNVDLYQELIGKLLYLANRIRPDITFVTSYLSQYNYCPKKRHYMLGKRVLRYLNGTKNKCLYYDRAWGILKAYSDATWGNAENGKSFSGGAVFTDNSLIFWKGKKKMNRWELDLWSRIICISEVVKDIIWLQNMFIELQCTEYISEPLNIYCDNQATIQWLKNAKLSTKTRHVNLKLHFMMKLKKAQLMCPILTLIIWLLIVWRSLKRN